MVTLNHIVSDIKNIATSGQLQYSFRIENEQIEYWIHEIRSMLISQAIVKKENISDVWIQSISCVDLEIVDGSECCLEDTGCKVLRSVKQLPPTIEYYNDNLIIRVVTNSGVVISKSNAFKASYQKYNKYVSNKPTWFLKNGYIYIKGTLDIEHVNIYGLFENPMDLAGFTSCEGQACFTEDSVYPVSLKMASDITNIVLKTKVYPFLSIPKDTSNNASDDEALSAKTVK